MRVQAKLPKPQKSPLFLRLKQDNVKWIHKEATRLGYSVSGYLDELIQTGMTEDAVQKSTAPALGSGIGAVDNNHQLPDSVADSAPEEIKAEETLLTDGLTSEAEVRAVASKKPRLGKRGKSSTRSGAKKRAKVKIRASDKRKLSKRRSKARSKR